MDYTVWNEALSDKVEEQLTPEQFILKYCLKENRICVLIEEGEASLQTVDEYFPDDDYIEADIDIIRQMIEDGQLVRCIEPEHDYEIYYVKE